MILKYKCLICSELFSPFGNHLKKAHNLSSKEYYDSYIKQEKDGKCVICGKNTLFHRLSTGYSLHCSSKCKGLDKEIVKKRKNTLKEKYGDENYVNMEEQYKTNLIKYGNKFSCRSKNNLEKTEQSIITKYGSLKQYNKIKNEKAQKTCFEKYGVKCPAQSSDIDCTSHRFTYNGLNFDSLWELKYYKYLVEHNINFTYKPKVKLMYEYEGITKYYKPDFEVEGKYVEIKGDQFFKNGKMICPFHKKDDTPEDIERRNGLFEAKHQCMIKNNVLILKHKELKELEII